jgi:hypothetical protein
MKKGDTVKPIAQLWYPTGGKVKIADTDDVLVLAALMEHDNSDQDVVVNNVDSLLRSTLAANRNLSHASLASKLTSEMNSALDQAVSHSAGNNDDRIGGAKSVNITPGNVLDASSGSSVQIKLSFAGYGGNYNATFTLSR